MSPVLVRSPALPKTPECQDGHRPEMETSSNRLRLGDQRVPRETDDRGRITSPSPGAPGPRGVGGAMHEAPWSAPPGQAAARSRARRPSSHVLSRPHERSCVLADMHRTASKRVSRDRRRVAEHLADLPGADDVLAKHGRSRYPTRQNGGAALAATRVLGLTGHKGARSTPRNRLDPATTSGELLRCNQRVSGA